MNGESLFHSVELLDEACKGCTICVTSCPVEAIRVHGGKAHILEEQCIDCGECIRKCPSHAKYSRTANLEQLENYEKKVALAAPAFYAQFNEKFSKQQINKALLLLGFDYVYDISNAALKITEATANFISTQKQNGMLKKPLISSSCPAIVKLIQIRYPTLIEHLLPLIPPSEHAARIVRKQYTKENNDKLGIFFISPCSAKVTVARSPLGYEKSEIDVVLSAANIYIPVLQALKKLELNTEESFLSDEDMNILTIESAIWCSSSGEAECLELAMNELNEDCKWVSASGITQALEILENTEDGQFDSCDYLEISACTGGCLGGPLTAVSSPSAEAILRRRLKNNKATINKNKYDNKTTNSVKEQKLCNKSINSKNSITTEFQDVLFTKEIIPRPAKLLNPDFLKAKKMMQMMEEITKELGGLDCGSCGAPNCRSLAEDIVKNRAVKEDCVIILKARYENMLFGDKKHGK